MCDFENGFILCSCKENSKPNTQNKKSHSDKNVDKETYRWTLSRFIGTFEAILEGMFEPPSHDLGAGLTEEWVLLNLNDRNCFDFDYTPQEGDLLSFSKGRPWNYMSFVFRQGSWIFDKYDEFSTKLEKVADGEILPLL
jgi:hypothetical protein